MQQYLKDLLLKIEAVDPSNGVPEPEREVKGDEKVVGVMPDKLKRIYAVFCASCDDMRERCDRVHDRLEEMTTKSPAEAKPEDLEIARSHTIAHKRHELLADIFWQAVDETFAEQLVLSKETVGIRKGWQVVTAPPRNSRRGVIGFLLGL